MKKLILAILLLTATNCMALDLEVYGGKIFNARNYGLSGSENPGYKAGIKVSEDFMWGFVTPSLGIETLMDSKRVENSLAIADGFHPTSVRYDAAVDLNIYKGLGIRGGICVGTPWEAILIQDQRSNILN
jgi:hypothetical protein